MRICHLTAVLTCAATVAFGLARPAVSAPSAPTPTAADPGCQVTTVSAASPAIHVNSGTGGQAMIYQPQYDSADWSGDLRVYSFDLASGARSSTPERSAGQLLDNRDWQQRNIVTLAVTRNGNAPTAGHGVPFRWQNGLTIYQKTLLNKGLPQDNAGQGQAILEYLRGNAANEGRNLGFRDRHAAPASDDIALLGDIIHSSPIYVGPPSAQFAGNRYSDFKARYADRAPMIYVGANDGMLHAFNANTLAEVFAYVPASLIPKLEKLTDPGYSHQYFVDGTPAVSDAYFTKAGEPSRAWHTVLVGTTGAGGSTVFALDITNPAQFDESHAADLVLWEISPTLDTAYADLGRTFSRPAIVRLANGQWGAVFGNGYGSANGDAVLYIANIATGTLIRTITLASGPDNGLSTPRVIDLNNDHVADRVYVGDIQGHLWVIDISSPDENDWGPAFVGAAGHPDPLFTATTPEGQPQPITTQPAVAFHPITGQIVLFGTGSYFKPGTNGIADSDSVQSFYGVWDSGLANQPPDISRGSLVEQTIIPATTQSGTAARTISSNPVRWHISPTAQHNVMGWYIDLPGVGERVIHNPDVRSSKLTIVTAIPPTTACPGDGNGWLMTLNPASGARLSFAALDVDGDNIVDDNDGITVANPDNSHTTITIPTAVVQTGADGVPSAPATVIDPGTTTEYNVMTTSTGATRIILGASGPLDTGRQSWHQLK